MMKILKSIKQIIKKTKSINQWIDNTVYEHLVDTIGLYSDCRYKKKHNCIISDTYYIAGGNCDIIIKLHKSSSQTYTVSVNNFQDKVLEESSSIRGIAQFITSLKTIERKYGLQELRKFANPIDAWRYADIFSTGKSSFKEKLKKKEAAHQDSKSTNEQTQSTYNRFGNTIYPHLQDAVVATTGVASVSIADYYYIAGGNCNFIIKLFVSKYPNYTYNYTHNCKYNLVKDYTLSVINTQGNYIEEFNSNIGIVSFMANLTTIEQKYGLQMLRKFSDPQDAWNYAHNFSANTDKGQEHTSSQSRAESQSQSQSRAESQSQSNSKTKQDYYNDYVPPNTSTQTMNYDSLFNGCTDKESLTKRYRQLMKTFHPDNPNGDQEMTQCIQKTYEALQKNY